MAINSKDIETLWQRYSAEGVPEPQQMLGLRLMAKKGLDAYVNTTIGI